MNKDESFIARCLSLAEKGKGKVSPNPMVGAVIVHNDLIIGEGYHQKYGESHAEVNAIKNVKDKSLLKHATLYVSLEPCNHHGKTPPCCDLIIENKIPRVVIGCKDSYKEVNGKGIEKLIASGIEVEIGILEKKCLALNKRFFTFHEKKRPYIILKWAKSQDGFMDRKRQNKKVGINWITQPETKCLTHKWRAQEDAILVGKNTIINDNPSLTTRSYDGENPLRVVLDLNKELNKTTQLFNDNIKTIIVNSKTAEKLDHIEYVKFNKKELLRNLMQFLYKRNIQSIIIEGGKKTIESFLKEDLWDEAKVLTGETFFEDGLAAPTLKKTPEHTFYFSTDRIDIFKK